MKPTAYSPTPMRAGLSYSVTTAGPGTGDAASALKGLYAFPSDWSHLATGRIDRLQSMARHCGAADDRDGERPSQLQPEQRRMGAIRLARLSNEHGRHLVLPLFWLPLSTQRNRFGSSGRPEWSSVIVYAT